VKPYNCVKARGGGDKSAIVFKKNRNHLPKGAHEDPFSTHKRTMQTHSAPEQFMQSVRGQNQKVVQFAATGLTKLCQNPLSLPDRAVISTVLQSTSLLTDTDSHSLRDFHASASDVNEASLHRWTWKVPMSVVLTARLFKLEVVDVPLDDFVIALHEAPGKTQNMNRMQRQAHDTLWCSNALGPYRMLLYLLMTEWQMLRNHILLEQRYQFDAPDNRMLQTMLPAFGQIMSGPRGQAERWCRQCCLVVETRCTDLCTPATQRVLSQARLAELPDLLLLGLRNGVWVDNGSAGPNLHTHTNASTRMRVNQKASILSVIKLGELTGWQAGLALAQRWGRVLLLQRVSLLMACMLEMHTKRPRGREIAVLVHQHLDATEAVLFEWQKDILAIVSNKPGLMNAANLHARMEELKMMALQAVPWKAAMQQRDSVNDAHEDIDGGGHVLDIQWGLGVQNRQPSVGLPRLQALGSHHVAELGNATPQTDLAGNSVPGNPSRVRVDQIAELVCEINIAVSVGACLKAREGVIWAWGVVCGIAAPVPATSHAGTPASNTGYACTGCVDDSCVRMRAPPPSDVALCAVHRSLMVALHCMPPRLVDTCLKARLLPELRRALKEQVDLHRTAWRAFLEQLRDEAYVHATRWSFRIDVEEKESLLVEQSTSDNSRAQSGDVSRSPCHYDFSDAITRYQSEFEKRASAGARRRWQTPRCKPSLYTRLLMRQIRQALQLWLVYDVETLTATVENPGIEEEITFFGRFLDKHFQSLSAACYAMASASTNQQSRLQVPEGRCTVVSQSGIAQEEDVATLCALATQHSKSLFNFAIDSPLTHTPVPFASTWMAQQGGVSSPRFARAVREPWQHLLANISHANQSPRLAQAAVDVPFPLIVSSCLEDIPKATGVIESWTHCEAMELCNSEALDRQSELRVAQDAGAVVLAQITQINAAVAFVTVILPCCS
jgi:hypothetical protein